MRSEALAWINEDLERTDISLVHSWTQAVRRCAREMGWTVSEWNRTGSGEGIRVHTIQAPYGGQKIELRAHELVPVVAFLNADDLDASLTTWASSWQPFGHPYIDPPGLPQWWQSQGWVVPDSAWMNDTPSPAELALFTSRRALEARRMGWSRGDLLLFPW